MDIPTKAPLGKPLKNQKRFMNSLSELISFLPDDWEHSFEIKSDYLIITKLLTEILIEAIKTAPVLDADLDSEKKKTAGLFKELRHLQNTKRESYLEGVRDAYGLVIDVEVRTPTARDALLDASAKLYGLLKEKDEENP